jgi:hypothetical protein
MALSAADAADRVEQLIQLTVRLTERLEAELVQLGSRRPHEVVETLPETARLANLYRHESLRLRSDRALITEAPPARLKALRRATEAFEAALQRHASALEAARTLTEGLVHAIATEVARQRAPAAGYGPKAKTKTADASAMTLNRRA